MQQAKKVISEIMNNDGINILALDCEAIVEMSKFGELSLIQVN